MVGRRFGRVVKLGVRLGRQFRYHRRS